VSRPKKKTAGEEIMSAADIDSGFDLAATRGGPDEISRRLESLPASSYLWRLVILLSLGGWFEVYDLFFTGYIAPGLNHSGLLTTTTRAFFGFSGIGAFVAATFAGLFVGTFALGFLADRFGRRSIFTYALLGYTAASVAMACQTTSEGVLLWRFIAGIGIGVEIITIDAYITELVPSWMRGRAFAVNQAIMFTAVPVVAALAWWLVPLSPYGVDGWRWVVLIGAAGSMVIWILRLFVPESPLWLARNGRTRGGRQDPADTRSLRWRDLGASGKSGRSVANTCSGEGRLCGAVQAAVFVACRAVHDFQFLPGLWRLWFRQLGSCATG
jgi:putative MFS transporter